LALLALSVVAAAQDKPTFNEGGKSAGDLELIRMGEVWLYGHHHGAFRTYQAPDGQESYVTYSHYRSVADANTQFKQWLKRAKTINVQETTKDSEGHAIGERVVAVSQEYKGGGNGFVIVKRVNLNCYLIESRTLPVALQIDSLLEKK
jgi:hypothetical protein